MSDYWSRRAIERMLRIELVGNGYADRIYQLYLDAYRELQDDLDALFALYAEQGDLDPIDAAKYLREPVTRAQADTILERIAEIQDPDVRRKMLAKANAGQYAARMKRLQAAQENIRAECAKVAYKQISMTQEALRSSGSESYYRTIFDVQKGTGVSVPFSEIRIEHIDSVLSERWVGANYSDRVWENTSAMADRLGEIVRTNVATGKSWKRCLDDIREFMATPGEGGLYAAERLLRTETARVLNEMSAEASIDIGMERYRFIAVLDLKTSEDCRRHDGLKDPDTKEFYTYRKRKVGVNFPPLHPNCRSCEAPVINSETLDGLTRPAKDPITGKTKTVPASMTYEDWYKQGVEGNPEAALSEKATKNTRPDRRQWQEYKARLGKHAPKTLAEFQRMKYTNPAEWSELKATYRDVGWMRRSLDNRTVGSDHREPSSGEPYSVYDKIVDGAPIRRRCFGRTGKVRKDIDFTDHGFPKSHPYVPHTHNSPEDYEESVYHGDDEPVSKADRIANDDLMKEVDFIGYG